MVGFDIRMVKSNTAQSAAANNGRHMNNLQGLGQGCGHFAPPSIASDPKATVNVVWGLVAVRTHVKRNCRGDVNTIPKRAARRSQASVTRERF